MKKVTIKRAILDMIEETDDTLLRELPLLKKWAVKADARIGSYYNYEKKNYVIEVENCSADIPCGVVHVLGIILGDAGCDCDVDFTSSMNIWTDTLDYISTDVLESQVVTWSDGTANIVQLDWEIQNGKIVFSSDYDGQYITIQGLSYEMDSEGYPIIYESHIDAISLFLKRKVLDREKWRLLKTGNDIRALQNELVLLERAYHRAVRYARTEDDPITESQRRQIAEMINDPLSGHGMYLLRLDNWY